MSYFEHFPTMLYDFTKQGSSTPNLIVVKDIIRRVKLRSRFANNVFAYDEYDIKEGERPDILAHQFYNSSKFAWILLVTNEIHDIHNDWPRTERELKKLIDKKYGGMGPYAVNGTSNSPGIHNGLSGWWGPLFLTETDAKNYHRLKMNGTGLAHQHTFVEFPSTTFWMPGNYGQGHAMATIPNDLYRVWTTNSGPDGIHHYERPQLSGNTDNVIITTESTYETYPSPGTVQVLNSTAITNRQYEERENEKKRRIKVLRANLVHEFTQEFKQLIKA